MPAAPTIEVMHGVNLDMLGARDADHYGSLTLPELERAIAEYGRELELQTSFFHTNSESEFVERLHALRDGPAAGLLLNPGAWTHYAWALHDALEIAALPAVEVHLSDVMQREPWRRQSVIRDVCVGSVWGRGAAGYRDALVLLKQALGAPDS